MIIENIAFFAVKKIGIYTISTLFPPFAVVEVFDNFSEVKAAVDTLKDTSGKTEIAKQLTTVKESIDRCKTSMDCVQSLEKEDLESYNTLIQGDEYRYLENEITELEKNLESISASIENGSIDFETNHQLEMISMEMAHGLEELEGKAETLKLAIEYGDFNVPLVDGIVGGIIANFLSPSKLNNQIKAVLQDAREDALNKAKTVDPNNLESIREAKRSTIKAIKLENEQIEVDKSKAQIAKELLELQKTQSLMKHKQAEGRQAKRNASTIIKKLAGKNLLFNYSNYSAKHICDTIPKLQLIDIRRIHSKELKRSKPRLSIIKCCETEIEARGRKKKV